MGEPRARETRGELIKLASNFDPIRADSGFVLVGFALASFIWACQKYFPSHFCSLASDEKPLLSVNI